MGSSLSLSSSRSSLRAYKGKAQRRNKSLDFDRVPVAALTTISEQQKQQLKRHLKQTLKGQQTCCDTTCVSGSGRGAHSYSNSKATKISLDLTEHPLDLEDSQILAMLVKYFAKYSSNNNTSEGIELEVFASSPSACGSASVPGSLSNYNHYNSPHAVDNIDLFDGLPGQENDQDQEAHLPVDGLVRLLHQSPVLRNHLTVLRIGQGCVLEGNLLGFFADTLPTLPKLRHLHLENLRVSACIAARIFPSWRQHNGAGQPSALETISLHSLYGDFEGFFRSMAMNQSYFPQLKKLHLHHLYVCRAGAVVQAAAEYLAATGKTSLPSPLEKLCLSFADDFDCQLQPLARALLAASSSLKILSIRHVQGRHFPIKSMQELDLFLQCAKECPSLQQLRLDINPSHITVNPSAYPSSSSSSSTLSSSPSRSNSDDESDDNEYNEVDQKEQLAMAQEKVEQLNMQLRLNRYSCGRRLLQTTTTPTLQDRVNAIVQAKDDTVVIYHYLSHDPSWITAASKQ